MTASGAVRAGSRLALRRRTLLLGAPAVLAGRALADDLRADSRRLAGVSRAVHSAGRPRGRYRQWRHIAHRGPGLGDVVRRAFRRPSQLRPHPWLDLARAATPARCAACVALSSRRRAPGVGHQQCDRRRPVHRLGAGPGGAALGGGGPWRGGHRHRARRAAPADGPAWVASLCCCPARPVSCGPPRPW